MQRIIDTNAGRSWKSTALNAVQSMIEPHERVLVILDSCHAKSPVKAELEASHSWVSRGSYVVATDGIMMFVPDAPHGIPNWKDDHPEAAAHEFAVVPPGFVLEQPAWPFNESPLSKNVAHWPGAWLRRVA